MIIPLGIAANARAARLPSCDDPAAELWRDRGGIVRMCSIPDGEDHWLISPGVGSFRFNRATMTVTGFPEPGVSPATLRDVYLCDVMPVVLHGAGIEVLHASAIRTPGGVVAFCADSGTGKTTLAHGLTRRGYEQWADDAVAFTVSDTVPADISAMPLPFQTRLRAASVAHFALTRESTAPASRPVCAAGSTHQTTPPLAAICFLERVPPNAFADGATVAITRDPPVAAFPALLAQTLALHADDVARRRTMVPRLLQVAAQIPVSTIRFAPGFETFPALLDAVERDVIMPLADGA